MPGIHTILHPTDFSPDAHSALEVACDIARENGARLIMLHVAVPPPAPDAQGLFAFDIVSFAMQERASLDRLVLEEAAIEPGCRFVVAADPVAEILRVADQEHCDLIVMGTDAAQKTGSAIVPDVTQRVQRGAACPVITAAEHEAGR